MFRFGCGNVFVVVSKVFVFMFRFSCMLVVSMVIEDGCDVVFVVVEVVGVFVVFGVLVVVMVLFSIEWLVLCSMKLVLFMFIGNRFRYVSIFMLVGIVLLFC